jgi:hypothetical protein
MCRLNAFFREEDYLHVVMQKPLETVILRTYLNCRAAVSIYILAFPRRFVNTKTKDRLSAVFFAGLRGLEWNTLYQYAFGNLTSISHLKSFLAAALKPKPDASFPILLPSIYRKDLPYTTTFFRE